MSNTLDGSSFAQLYKREAQEVDQVVPVYRAICKYNGFPAEMLSYGDSIILPKTSALYVSSYTRGSAVNIQDLTNSIDTLTIDQQNEISFYVDEFDEAQQTFDAAIQYGGIAGNQLSVEKDAIVLGEYGSAAKTVDDSDISAGTTGNGFTATVSNIYQSLTVAKEKMALQNIPKKMLFAVFSPNLIRLWEEYLINRGTPGSDEAMNNGYSQRLSQLLGVDVFESNNLTCTFTLVLSSTVNDAETITFTFNDYASGSITFTLTFKTTLTGTATLNEVLIGANAAASRVNLAKSINNSGTVDTHYSAYSAANRARLRNLVATDDLSSKVTFVWKGAGTITLAETLTGANNAFTAAAAIQHQLVGVKGFCNVASQIEPKVRIRPVETKFGSNFLNGQLWGKKTATDGGRRLVDVQVAFNGGGF